MATNQAQKIGFVSFWPWLQKTAKLFPKSCFGNFLVLAPEVVKIHTRIHGNGDKEKRYMLERKN